MRRTTTILLASFAALSLAACNSPADKQAEATADNLEAKAAASPNEAEETKLNREADRIEQQGGNADGGATTENMPTTK